MSEESEMWRAYNEKKKEDKVWHQKNTLPGELELLEKLNVEAKIHIIEKCDDGSGGE